MTSLVGGSTTMRIALAVGQTGSQLSPSLSASQFLIHSLQSMETLSHVGLVLYLFLAGLELDTKQLKQQKEKAFATSLISIFVPFLAAALLAHLSVWFAPIG